MSGKFMSVRKIVIPTITLIVLTSQLMGCSSVSKSEFVQMVNNSEAIEIEVATPSAEAEQGKTIELNWTQLDQLQTQPTLRKSMDTLFKIVPYGDNSKNGVFYINLEGNQEGNNTLYNTFANSAFRKAWTDEETQESLASLATENYADIEVDNISEACLAALNGYFNILEDAEGYANMDSTITRLEAMSAIFKAENPVTDKLAEDTEFNKAVDPEGKNPNTIYASNLSEQSYLDIASGSLDTLTANGTITRGELAYLIVQQYFSDDYDKVDIKKAEVYADVENAGSLAEKNKATDKQHWQAYELTCALKNPAEGCPERMYKALAVAKEKEIITGEESRWDEGATKEDLLEMLTNAYLQLAPQTKDNLGKGDGEALAIEDTKAEESKKENETPVPDNPDYQQTYMTFEEIEPTTMYANKDGIMFGNPNQFEGKVLTQGAIEKGVEYVVTMKGTYENTEYYGLVGGQNNIYIIKAEDLSDTKPAEPTPTTAPAKTDNSSSGNSGGSNGSSGGSSDNSGNSGANVTYAPDTVGGAIESGAVGVIDVEGEAPWTDELLDMADGFTIE